MKSRGGLGRLRHALRYSLNGFIEAVRVEAAVRQELCLCAVLVPVALLIPVTTVERILLIASLMLLLIVELLNSAIEAVVDRVSLERHNLSRRAKDMGSAAVFLTLLTGIFIWSTILCAYFFN